MPKFVMVPGEQFAKLLADLNLRSMVGYAQVAKWLYVKPQTVRVMCIRGCPRVYYNYVKLKSKEGDC